MNVSLLQLLPYTLQPFAIVWLTLRTAVIPELTQASGASNGLCQTRLGRAGGPGYDKRVVYDAVSCSGFGLG